MDSSSFYPVVKAKRFAPLEKLLDEQKKRFSSKAKEIIPESERDSDFDWVEDFREYAMMTGAFQRDL